MSRRSIVVVAAILVLLAGAAGWSGWQQARESAARLAFSERRLAFLDAETRRLQNLLADQQRLTLAADQRQRRQEIEAAVERLRGLPFVHPVVYREIPRTQLPAILRAKLSQQIPDQEFAHNAIALATLGLIPAGLDLKQTYLGLLGEQVGAFYDQHSAELFTFAGQGLASAQNQVILAHELTHALEDQHFQLARLPLEAKGNDDRVLAASALVEGDATLVMNRYMLDHLNAAAVRESLVAAVSTDVYRLAAAPRFLRETLLFPYLRGQEFCQALYDAGGWPELARAFAHPPASTSLILHPDRYLSRHDDNAAVDITFRDTTVLGQTPIDENVLGEFGLRQWLLMQLKEETRATKLAAGWAGDRYLIYGDAGAASSVWMTAWRSAAEAAAFAAAASPVASEGRGGSSATLPAAQPPESASAKTRIGRRGQRFVMTAVDGAQSRVLVIDACDAQWFDALRARFGDEARPPAAAPANVP